MPLINLIFPTFCLICRKDGNYICRGCYLEMSPIFQIRCPACDHPSYKYHYHVECKEKFNFEGLFYIFNYGDKFHDVIETVKYQFYFDICPFLGKLLAKNFRSNIEFDYSRYIVTSVPVHSSKLKSRGFNQAELIAKSFADELGLSYENLLKRVRKTQTQVGLDKLQRVANLKNSFKFASRNPVPQNVLLIDDVFTTGTTIRECTETLKNAGVQSVFVAVLAKAMS